GQTRYTSFDCATTAVAARSASRVRMDTWLSAEPDARGTPAVSADDVSLHRKRGAVRPERGERGVLCDALRVVGDNGERLEHERHSFGPKRRGRGVDRFGHVE